MPTVGAVTASGADQGYVLVSPMEGHDTYLLNSQGQVVNTWVSSYDQTGRSCYLLPNGDLIRTGSLAELPRSTLAAAKAASSRSSRGTAT